jgi:hypothetical protein
MTIELKALNKLELLFEMTEFTKKHPDVIYSEIYYINDDQYAVRATFLPDLDSIINFDL